MKSANLHQGKSGPDLQSTCIVQIRMIPKFNEDFPVQRYICDKISMKIRSDYEPNGGKMPHFAMSKKPLKYSWIRIEKWMTSKI